MSIYAIFSLLGGIGLFLFGMSIMSTGLRDAAGNNLQNILEKATKNRFLAILVGLGMTLLIQSSSATDVMVIGFVNAGMMKLTQAIGVIMGANIGTTITAQITAFNLGNFTPLILIIGVVIYVFIKKSFVKHIGSVIMGFGMLFEGIIIMKAAIAPLSETQGFISFMDTLSNPVLAFLFGIAFTALLQSSSSSVVTGPCFEPFDFFLSLDFFLVFFLTPNLLAGLTANRNGKRGAILNLLFNVIRAGILIVLINLIPQILTLIQALSPDDIARQIANTHTIFAIAAVLIEAPFANKLVDLSKKIIPVKPEELKKLTDRELQYLDIYENMPPAAAMHQAHLEVARMGRISSENLKLALDAFFKMESDKIAVVKENEETIDILNHKIAHRMVHLRSLTLVAKDLERISQLSIVVTDIERLSDHAENIAEYIDLLKERRGHLSDTAMSELKEMTEAVLKAVDMSLEIFTAEDYTNIDSLEEIENSIDIYEETLINRHVDRLMTEKCDPVAGVVFIILRCTVGICLTRAVTDCIVSKCGCPAHSVRCCKVSSFSVVCKALGCAVRIVYPCKITVQVIGICYCSSL